MTSLHEDQFAILKHTMDQYAELSAATWQYFRQICSLVNVKKKQHLIRIGQKPDSFYFVCSGLFRLYTLTETPNDKTGEVKEYNKMFFTEGSFPGTMPSLLQDTTSDFGIQALEDAVVIRINHKKYRELLERKEDLKWYHIQYIEQNWILKKEPIEVALAMQDAKSRYIAFSQDYPNLVNRVSQHHIASKLGITPTQLSRIRKSLK